MKHTKRITTILLTLAVRKEFYGVSGEARRGGEVIMAR